MDNTYNLIFRDTWTFLQHIQFICLCSNLIFLDTWIFLQHIQFICLCSNLIFLDTWIFLQHIQFICLCSMNCVLQNTLNLFVFKTRTSFCTTHPIYLPLRHELIFAQHINFVLHNIINLFVFLIYGKRKFIS
jgi:hypothetical protein